jgi:hypothetical protein
MSSRCNAHPAPLAECHAHCVNQQQPAHLIQCRWNAAGYHLDCRGVGHIQHGHAAVAVRVVEQNMSSLTQAVTGNYHEPDDQSLHGHRSQAASLLSVFFFLGAASETQQ